MGSSENVGMSLFENHASGSKADVFMLIDDQRYSFVKCSDLIRDGFVLECWRGHGDSDDEMVAEAFWHDPTGAFTVQLFVDTIHFALAEAFLREAAKWCPPTLSQEVGTRKLIYIPLLGENVDVWRPVVAEFLGANNYRIVGQNISPEDEHWAFETDEIVKCEEKRFGNGSSGLVAITHAD